MATSSQAGRVWHAKAAMQRLVSASRPEHAMMMETRPRGAGPFMQTLRKECDIGSIMSSWERPAYCALHREVRASWQPNPLIGGSLSLRSSAFAPTFVKEFHGRSETRMCVCSTPSTVGEDYVNGVIRDDTVKFLWLYMMAFRAA
jgi:hypothetical protein